MTLFFKTKFNQLWLSVKSAQYNYYVLLALSMGIISNAHALTLDESIAFALAHESQLKISELTIQQQEAVVQQAKAQDQLSISLNGQLGRDKTVTAQGVILPVEGLKSPRSAELQFSYPIYTSGRHALRIDAAQSQYTAARFGFENTKSQTIYRTVQAYTDVLRNQALVALEGRVSANLKQALKEAESRFSASVITRADLAQAKSQYAQGQANYIQTQANLRISQTLFFQLTGQSASNLQPINKTPVVPANLDDALKNIEETPALVQAKYELKAAEQQYKLVKLELKPTVLFTSKASAQNEVSSINSRSENYAIGLQANIPLYDGGLNNSNRQKAVAQVRLAAEKIDALRQTLGQNIEATFTQLDATKENERAIAEAVTSASVALEFIKKELEFGSKTTFDLLNAEQTLRNVETQQILNQQDQVMLSYQLLSQMGQLKEAL